MLAALRFSWPRSQAELYCRIHRYYLACCRRISPLLPGDAIRMALQATEPHFQGTVVSHYRPELADLAEWYLVQIGTGFDLAEESLRATDEPLGPKDHWELHCLEVYERWVGVIAEIPSNKLRKLVRTPEGCPELSPGEVLYRAACFAFDVLHHGGNLHLENQADHARFLSAHLLRETFEYPLNIDPVVDKVRSR